MANIDDQQPQATLVFLLLAVTYQTEKKVKPELSN